MDERKQVYALFTKVAGRWRFEGFAYRQLEVKTFTTIVEAEIRLTKDSDVKTTAYRVVPLGE